MRGQLSSPLLFLLVSNTCLHLLPTSFPKGLGFCKDLFHARTHPVGKDLLGHYFSPRNTLMIDDSYLLVITNQLASIRNNPLQ